MDPKFTVHPRKSIRVRLLALILAITLVSLGTLSFLAVNALNQAGEQAQETSRAIFRSQAEDYLITLVNQVAQKNSQLINRSQHDAEHLSRYMTDILSNKQEFQKFAYWDPEENIQTGDSGQLLNSAEDLVSVFVPNTVDQTPALYSALEISSHIDYLLQTIAENNTNVTAAYFGTEDNITRYYPNIELGKVVPPDFSVTQRPWYQAAITDNPGMDVIWSPIYTDATGQGLLVTAASPVTNPEDEILGVIGLDVSLNSLTNSVEETQVFEESYSFLIDDQGNAIALPEEAFQDLVGRTSTPEDLGLDLTTIDTPYSSLIENMLDQESGFEIVQSGESEKFIAYTTMEGTDWHLATVVDAEEILQVLPALESDLQETTRELLLTNLLPAGGAILVLTVIIVLIITNYLSRPLRDLTTSVQNISAGNWDTSFPEFREDEIGVVGKTFQEMAKRLRETLSTLEKRVEDRTRALARRAEQLRAAAEVGNAAVTIRDLNELLSEVTHLISDRFNFYHVGIFLLNPTGEYAVLQAANSVGGQRMLRRGHRLKVGEVGIVGYVTDQKEARIALDVGKDAVFFDNPDLPETRSEMALPLIIGDQLLGALDVQSKTPQAFSEEDIEILEVLADQIAVAIQNARLFEENQSALEAARRAYQETTMEAWGELLRTQPQLGYLANPQMLQPANNQDERPEIMETALETGEITYGEDATVAIPIKIRDQVLGAVRLEKDDPQTPWTEDEIEVMSSIADQLSIALDSARLYSDTQRRAERERLVTEITTKIRSTTEPDQMLQIAVNELKNVLNVDQAHFIMPSNRDRHPKDEA
jgi:GAF domain-containing protein/HAMP domain-containing protein